MKRFTMMIGALFLVLLSACAYTIPLGAKGLAEQTDAWPPIGMHRLELLNVLGPTTMTYTTENGQWREQMTWHYTEFYYADLATHYVMYVKTIDDENTTAHDGGPIKGMRCSLQAVFNQGGLLVSRLWNREVLVIENKFLGTTSWRPFVPPPAYVKGVVDATSDLSGKR